VPVGCDDGVPPAPGGAGHLEPDPGAHRPRERAERVRQGPGEGVEHRRHDLRGVEAGAADGVADLLLVHPVLGVLPRDVEPARCRVRPGPGHVDVRGAQQVGLGPVRLELLAEQGVEVTQHPWAQLPGDPDELLVGAVEPLGQRRAGWQRDPVAVAGRGQPPGVVVDDVGEDVPDRPAGHRLALPVRRLQPAQQLVQGRPLAREQRPHVDRRPQRAHRHHHVSPRRVPLLLR
jgi:hypothetical protein